MKYHISSSLFVLFCIVLCACNSSSVEKDGIIQPAFDLIERQIGERAADIQLEEIAPENGKETFEVEAKNGILTLRGSSSVAICYAFYTYLREACSAMKTWSGERMELPETWPDFSLKKQTTPYEYRYFLNVCTFGYTTPYWDWERWEKEIAKWQRDGRDPAPLLPLRWMVEELRISLFAQELRTPQPVSVKRLDKLWAQVNS